MTDAKVKQLTNALWRIDFLPVRADDKKNVASSTSAFLTKPAHLVVSAPIPDSWYGLCSGSAAVASLKLLGLLDR